MTRFAGHKFTLTPSHWATNLRWELRGPDGGVHFHVSIPRNPEYSVSAGLEIHRCAPAEYQVGSAPHHIDCPVTGGRCWHDGTSLYAIETLWPRFEFYYRGSDHDAAFRDLEHEYNSRFDGEDAQ